jgi:hypothetical protein
MRRRLLFLLILLFAGTNSGLHVVAQQQQDNDKKAPAAKKRKPNFTVGRHTTYIDGPFDKDGYPDYEAALNERLREGVTPDNNANVLLFKAFGPRPDGSDIPDEFFKWMKIAAPPAKGDYFVSAGKHVSEKVKGDKDEQRKKVDDVYDLLDNVTKRPWSAKEHPDIAEWLKRNEKPLALAVEASKRPRYYYPLVAAKVNGKSSSLITALISGVQGTRQLAEALSARAMLRVAEKRYDDAWQDLLARHRLARLVGNGGTLIESLVSIALETNGLDADLAFLESAKLDSKQIRRCLADLQKLPPRPSLAEQVGSTERFTFLQVFMLLDRDGPEILDGLSGGKGPAKRRHLAPLALSCPRQSPASRRPRRANAAQPAHRLRPGRLSARQRQIPQDLGRPRAQVSGNRPARYFQRQGAHLPPGQRRLSAL